VGKTALNISVRGFDQLNRKTWSNEIWKRRPVHWLSHRAVIKLIDKRLEKQFSKVQTVITRGR